MFGVKFGTKFGAKSNKNLFNFLLIILGLSSLNAFSMKHIDMQNLSRRDKFELAQEQKQVSEIKLLITENGEAYYVEGLAQMLEAISGLTFIAHIPDAKDLIIKLKDLLINKIKKQLETDKYLKENDLKTMLKGLMVLKMIRELKSIQGTSLVDSLKEVDFTGLMNSIVTKIDEVKKSDAKTKELMNLAKKVSKNLPKDRVIIDTSKKGETLYSGKTPKEMRQFNEFQ